MLLMVGAIRTLDAAFAELGTFPDVYQVTVSDYGYLHVQLSQEAFDVIAKGHKVRTYPLHGQRYNSKRWILIGGIEISYQFNQGRERKEGASG